MSKRNSPGKARGNMDNNEVRRRVFRQELYVLKEKGYLNEELVEVVSAAHHQYHLDLVTEQNKKIEIVQNKVREELKGIVPNTPPKVKKVRSPEEIRERNITWLLNLGVIMLLIGGLFVATSNWETMTAMMKSGSIAAVSLLFYGFSYLSRRVMNIEKTSFAFAVLGSLFLPIFVLSLGWFGLLGPYLSITGEGIHFLGVLGSFLPIVVYLYFANRLNSRLFVWFSYISLTIGTAFLLAALNLPIDYFYLGMVIYNALLVYSLYFLKKKNHLNLYTKELAVFAQINLVLSTLTMIFLYEQYVTNSFNILLTSAIYLSMIFVTGTKEYHFIFSAMIVYGSYQLIEHSFLEMTGPILYALMAVGFLFITRILNFPDILTKIFQITSAIISVLTFIYISVEGLLLRAGEPSIILLFAYLIIGSHFVYMCYFVNKTLFKYLSPVFYGAALFELVLIIDKLANLISFALEIYVAGFLLFIIFGTARMMAQLGIIRKSSRDVGVVIMFIAIFLALGVGHWWELGVMLLCFSFVSYLLIKLDERTLYLKLSSWIMPITFGLAVLSLNQEWSLQSTNYQEHYGTVVGFVVGSLLLLLMSIVWGRFGEEELDKNSFFTAQFLYTAGIVYSLIGHVDPVWVRPCVFLGGIFVYLLLFNRIKASAIPYPIAVTTLLFYFSLVDSIERQIGISDGIESLIITSGGVLLLLISIIVMKKSIALFQGFSWIGHLYYPMSLIFTFFVYQQESMWSFMIALTIYVSSLKLTNHKWKRFVFLFSSYTALVCLVASLLNQGFYHYQDYHAFIVTSGIMVLIWFVMNPFYKLATMYYWVPFSLIGIFSCVSSGPFHTFLYTITVVYIAIVLIFIHLMKWELIPFFPLLLLLVATVKYTFNSQWNENYDLLLITVIGIVLFFIGKFLYQQIIEKKGADWPKLDVYSLMSFLYFLYLYTFDFDTIWLHAIPGLLIALTLYSQRGRVPQKWSLVISMIAVILLLEPYYSVILRLNLPTLWEREIVALPFVLLIIFIRVIWKGRYENIINSIQWIVLIMVALTLIQDGLASSTIYDAIILGTMSLISLLSGMFLRIKAYFFVGSGVLLLNVFLQTRPFWGNMPWWAYLLIAGSILIFVASYNEWHKQKTANGEVTVLIKVKRKIVQKWKEWN
jgi:hypothetical protein